MTHRHRVPRFVSYYFLFYKYCVRFLRNFYSVEFPTTFFMLRNLGFFELLKNAYFMALK